jgi:hypothetical protein
MVVVIDGLYPAVTSLDGETAGHAFGCKQLIPVFFTVWQAILQIEWRVGE